MRAALKSLLVSHRLRVRQITGSPWGAVHGAPAASSDAESRDPMHLSLPTIFCSTSIASDPEPLASTVRNGSTDGMCAAVRSFGGPTWT